MKSLIPWRRETGPFELMRREMDELMRHFIGPFVEPERGPLAWAPRVDVEETEKEFVVKVDLPGVDPKDVEVTLREGVLVLRGEKKEEKEEKKANYHRLERFVGEFYREVPLPSAADAEKITAIASKGVITVTVPKKPEATAKKITVKATD
jgi:HSP20 family protein